MRLNVQRAFAGARPAPFTPTRLFPKVPNVQDVWLATGTYWLLRVVVLLWLLSIAGVLGHRVAHWRPGRRAANLGRKIQRVFVRVTRLTVAQTLHVFALTALAVAQPLFDVVSREPSFFVARNTTAANLVALVAVVCIALPMALVAIEVALGRFSAPAARVAHGVVITVLGAALLLPLLKRAEVLGAAQSITVTLTVAGIAALAYRRFDVVRTFLTLLSPAVVVVPAVFLMHADVRGAVVRTDDLFSSVHPAERAADRHCCLRRISSQLLVGRQSGNRSGALPELRASGDDRHVVSQRQHRVLSDHVGGSRYRHRPVSGSAECRADAALLPEQPVHHAQRALSDDHLRPIPPALPGEQLRLRS